jgi:uncharacterized protein YndB with AHSA1/START domain
MAVETQGASSTDRIEKKVVLHAPRSRVWRAISNSQEFGTWFRLELDGGFEEGATVHGRITHPGYEHVTLDLQVERIDPERYFAYRWHPYAIDPAIDYTREPTTLVEFTLREVEGGTELTIVESGFDRIPLARQSEAYRMNDRGWAGQIANIARHVA